MRTGSIFLLIALIVTTGGCERKQKAATPRAVPVRQDGALELRLMSFNIRYENPQDAAERSWQRRLVEAVHLIQREKPDVFGVQEAMHGQAADLRASLPDYEFHGIGRVDGKREGEYAGIFYRSDRFEQDSAESGTAWLSDEPGKPGSKTWGNAFPRILSWVRLVDRASGRGFYAYNTHWDHQNQYARERSALFLSTQIDARPHPDDPVVVMGDFNAVEANPGFAYLTGKKVSLAGRPARWAAPLTDTFQLLHAGVKNRRTLHFWTMSTEGSLKVDHILVSKNAKVLKSSIISKSPAVISDHFPVTARVVFP